MRSLIPSFRLPAVPDMGNLDQGWLRCSNEEFLMFEEFTVWNIGFGLCFPLTSYERRGTGWAQGIAYKQRDTAESDLVVDFTYVRS